MRAGDQVPSGLEGVLDALPGRFVVAADGEARLVIGPAGAFVLLPVAAGRVGLADASRQVSALATTTRTRLCDHLAWVPFLDPLLVSTSAPAPGAEVTVAPLDLLPEVLTGGPPRIDGDTLTAVADALRARHLGRWRPAGDPLVAGAGVDGGRIEGCENPHRSRTPGRR